MSVRRLLETSKDEVVAAYRGGASTCELGRRYGCSNASVFLALRRWGEPIRETKVSASRRSDVLRLHAEGLTAYKIARKVGVSESSVSRILRAAGIDISAGRWRRDVPLTADRDVIVSRYLSGEGCDLIAADYGCQRTSVMKLLRRSGVEMRDVRDYAYRVDESFFDAVDTEQKAYTLGFWMADGCNCQQVPYIGMSITDRDILQDMCGAMGYEGPIREVQPRRSGYLTQFSISIGSRKLSDSLARLGCVRGKTYTAEVPSEELVPPHLVRHMVRGWMDGDGTITSRPGRRQWHMRIVGTEAVCRGLSELANKHLGFPGSVCPVHVGKFHTTFGFTVSGRNQLKAFLAWLYADATIFLARKRAKYDEFLAATACP